MPETEKKTVKELVHKNATKLEEFLKKKRANQKDGGAYKFAFLLNFIQTNELWVGEVGEFKLTKKQKLEVRLHFGQRDFANFIRSVKQVTGDNPLKGEYKTNYDIVNKFLEKLFGCDGDDEVAEDDPIVDVLEIFERFTVKTFGGQKAPKPVISKPDQTRFTSVQNCTRTTQRCKENSTTSTRTNTYTSTRTNIITTS